MPISRKQFKAGVNSESLQVLEFLFQNKEQAFTDNEIAKALKLDEGKLQKLLIGLNQRGYVDVGIVGDIGYFSVGEKFLQKAGELGSPTPPGEPFPLPPNPARDKPTLADDDKTRYIG